MRAHSGAAREAVHKIAAVSAKRVWCLARAASFLAVLAPVLTGCAHAGRVYSPPGPGEAQALVEVRTRYAPIPWQKLVERIEIDGAPIEGPGPAASGHARRLAVRPGVAKWTVDSSLYVVRYELQERMVAVATMCGSNMACSTFVPMQVEVQVNVPVAVCRASIAQDVVAGKQYVLQFDLAGHGQCLLACYRQRPGSVDALEPCAPAAAPR